jgi:predicted nucleic acid-binding protein
MLVLDASVALAWGIPDEASDFADSIKAEVVRSGAIVPALWITEVIAGGLSAQRQKRFAAETLDEFLAGVARLLAGGAVRVSSPEPSKALVAITAIARELQISPYDAAYIFTAAEAAVPLATADRALKQAAARVGIPTPS